MMKVTRTTPIPMTIRTITLPYMMVTVLANCSQAKYAKTKMAGGNPLNGWR